MQPTLLWPGTDSCCTYFDSTNMCVHVHMCALWLLVNFPIPQKLHLVEPEGQSCTLPSTAYSCPLILSSGLVPCNLLASAAGRRFFETLSLCVLHSQMEAEWLWECGTQGREACFGVCGHQEKGQQLLGHSWGELSSHTCRWHVPLSTHAHVGAAHIYFFTRV